MELWSLAFSALCPHLVRVPVSSRWLSGFKEVPGIFQPKSILRNLRSPKGHMWSPAAVSVLSAGELVLHFLKLYCPCADSKGLPVTAAALTVAHVQFSCSSSAPLIQLPVHLSAHPCHPQFSSLFV